ncbi:hypothetical protein VSH64_40785 [Amycolatopsis rhabdoformis]|uniref:DUF3040 domain-containing protein n=1 Tax=Amycolatopsis rhabdoformis TaxID=1448059 RepID=A0ABZ1I5G5_9PSEU|nr:hypothetical protein [Amycolatopsis rhabdoformis]WSE29088.1 hypothetical protein VSH64_40785 [Amycolatopsis rhabdoformis]
MTDDTAALPRYYSTSDLHPEEVQKRLKESAEVGHNQAHVQRLLVELLAQQIATRRYVMVLTTIAVIGVVASVICGIVIASGVSR